MPEKYTLRELRARKDWTQEETAKRLGVSLQTYNAWEQNFGSVKVSPAAAIAKVFGVPLDSIFLAMKLKNLQAKLKIRNDIQLVLKANASGKPAFFWYLTVFLFTKQHFCDILKCKV